MKDLGERKKLGNARGKELEQKQMLQVGEEEWILCTRGVADVTGALTQWREGSLCGPRYTQLLGVAVGKGVSFSDKAREIPLSPPPTRSHSLPFGGNFLHRC